MEKKEPLISVIVPVYKAEPYLGRCVDSILAQTYPNLEIILIDDGSPDRCGEICDEYAAKDSRIRVIHQENGGLSAARNTGLDICTGEYIAFVDSDDYVEPDMLRQLMNGSGDADLCGCGMIREEQDGTILSVTKTTNVCALPGIRVLRQHYSGENGKMNITEVSVWAKLYRRSLWAQLRFQPGLIFEDLHLMPFLLRQCRTIRYIPYAGYHYLVTPGSLTTEQDEQHQKRCYEDCFRIWEDHQSLYRSNGWNDLLIQVKCAMADKLMTHILNGKVPPGYEYWSRKLLYRTVVGLLIKPIGMSRKLRYVAFCLLGKRGYRLLRKNT